MLAGDAPRPAIGRCTPSFIDAISSSLPSSLWAGRRAPSVILIGAVGAKTPNNPRSTDRPSGSASSWAPIHMAASPLPRHRELTTTHAARVPDAAVVVMHVGQLTVVVRTVGSWWIA